jgi:hypothetical protein
LLSVLKGANLVIVGDINFTLNRLDIWGTVACLDVQSDYFLHHIRSIDLFDVEPIKLNPTWCNKRLGAVGVSQR